MKKLAIFGSGSGGNAENICDYFANSSDIEVVFICTNNKAAFIVKRAEKLNIPIIYTTKDDLTNFNNLRKILSEYNVDYIILAGFLLKLPSKMVNSYPKKIINIHPSLLPKYGGKGMYGKNVHSAVIDHNEMYSGITIHYVNENYDDGAIIFQYPYKIKKEETPESLGRAVQKIEHRCFPLVLEKIIKSQLS